MSDAQKIGDSLDPAQYASHVTRTAILLEQLARDVSALREETERNIQGTGNIDKSIQILDRELAVFRESTTSRVTANETAIKDIAERLKWISRLVIGTLITGAISGIMALVIKAISQGGR